MDNPHAVMARLAEIEEQLAENQNGLEGAAHDYFSLKRWRDLKRAKILLSKSGGTIAEREAETLVQLSESEATKDDYARFIVAEAMFESMKLAHKSLDARASIGQSILKAQTASGEGRPQRGGM